MGGPRFHLFLPALLSAARADAPATSSPLNWTGDVLHRSIEAVTHQPHEHYANLRQAVDEYLADALGGTHGEALLSVWVALAHGLPPMAQPHVFHLAGLWGHEDLCIT